MRKQPRPPAPPILVQHGERWTRQWSELRAANTKATFQWYQVEGRSAREWLLPDLKDITQGHCAFCDCFPLDDRSTEPIEHFRPKSDPRFYTEAYAWENLFYCCDRCQKNKREQWDDGLLRPDAEDYTFIRYFMFDYTTGEIRPNILADAVDQARAQVTIALYGLDQPERRSGRRRELRDWQRMGGQNDLNNRAYRDFLETAEADTPST